MCVSYSVDKTVKNILGLSLFLHGGSDVTGHSRAWPASTLSARRAVSAEFDRSRGLHVLEGDLAHRLGVGLDQVEVEVL